MRRDRLGLGPDKEACRLPVGVCRNRIEGRTGKRTVCPKTVPVGKTEQAAGDRAHRGIAPKLRFPHQEPRPLALVPHRAPQPATARQVGQTGHKKLPDRSAAGGEEIRLTRGPHLVRAVQPAGAAGSKRPPCSGIRPVAGSRSAPPMAGQQA